MEVNRQNYEMYLLDYIEGNLPENMVLAVLTFLKNNPDIENEFNGLLDNFLVAEPVEFESKETLKKNPETDISGISKFEQLSVAYLENEISNDNLKKLNIILDQDNTRRVEHQILQKTKLQADLSIIYQFKSELKHIIIGKNISKIYSYFAIAASIIVLVGFTLFFIQGNSVHYGSAFKYNTYDFKIREIKFEQSVYQAHIIKENNYIVANVVKDTFSIRNSEKLQAINSIQIAQIDASSKYENISIAQLNSKPLTQNSGNDGYTPFKTFLNHKFKEKVLKQDQNEKVTFVSVANAIGGIINKVFNKNIKVEKTITNDGSSLYAIKTDSFDFYSKTRNREKNKDNTDEQNRRQYKDVPKE